MSTVAADAVRKPADLARFIDHTNLKPEATPADIQRLCQEAREFEFASVCVNPCYVSLCKQELSGSSVHVGTVVGFPLGATNADQKVFEAKTALRDGANEVDMVINVGFLKAGLDDEVAHEIARVSNVLGGRAVLKVIIETCLLTDEEKRRACLLAKEAGADYVKTSTGFNKAGATVEDVRLMRETVGPQVGVKAAGGIRDAATALAMIRAGADRIGTSSGVVIVTAERF